MLAQQPTAGLGREMADYILAASFTAASILT